MKKLRSKQKIAAASVFILALIIQGYAVSHPNLIPATVEANKRDPLTASRDLEQEIVITYPASASTNASVLEHIGSPNEVMDVTFEKAHITPATLKLLAGNYKLPDYVYTWSRIHYYERGTGKSLEGSSPYFAIQPPKTAQSIHFYQEMPPGGTAYRSVSLQISGGNCSISLYIRPPAPNPDDLSSTPIVNDIVGVDIGEGNELWRHHSPGLVPINIEVENNSPVTITFTQAGNERLWESADSYFDPFTERSLSIPASRLAVQSRKTPSEDSEGFYVSHWMGQPSELIVKSLRIGSDKLETTAEGKAVPFPPDEKSPGIFDRLAKLPLLALTMGAINIAILGWVRSVFFPATAGEEAEEELAEAERELLKEHEKEEKEKREELEDEHAGGKDEHETSAHK